MKLEEAIVFLLASSGHGMKTEQIAREINERKLYERWGHESVTGKQVYAVIMSHPDTFVKSEGRIRPIYAVDYHSGVMQRTPGGTSHWLFCREVLKDMGNSLKELFG